MTARRVAWVLVAVCVVYLVLAGQRGIELIGLGSPVEVALGVAVIVVTVLRRGFVSKPR